MSRRRGFSVLESVVAICLLALVMVCLFTLYPVTGLSVTESRQSLEAQSLADSMLEQLQAESFSSVALGVSDWSPVTRNGVEYSRHLEVFPVQGRDPDFLRAVEVRVSWKSATRSRQIVREQWLSSVGR